MTSEGETAIIAESAAFEGTERPVRAMDYESFLSHWVPPQETLLAPWLPKKGLAMVHAARGVGKTHFAHGVAWAVATGTRFLRWEAGAGPARVVLLDGEMPTELLQDRLREVAGSAEQRPPAPDFLRIAAADLRQEGLPDLADRYAQRYYDMVVRDADLVIVDNLSTLCRSLKENDADSWGPVQDWCLALRRQGKAVLLVHHNGKNNGQRGTSKKEDVLDSVISLRSPADYRPEDGARFEVHFTKHRRFSGPDAQAFEARLSAGVWLEAAVQHCLDDDALLRRKRQGASYRELAEESGISKSALQRRLAELDRRPANGPPGDFLSQ